MKLVLLGSLAFILCGCSPELSLKRNTKKVIRKVQRKSECFFECTLDGCYINVIWYYKNNTLIGYKIRPYDINVYNLPYNNCHLDADSLFMYLDTPLEKRDECFLYLLDGPWISFYDKKNKEPLECGLNFDCLFNTKYEKCSFPYILKNTLSKLNICPSKN